jgi:hypothetical protein
MEQLAAFAAFAAFVAFGILHRSRSAVILLDTQLAARSATGDTKTKHWTLSINTATTVLSQKPPPPTFPLPDHHPVNPYPLIKVLGESL